MAADDPDGKTGDAESEPGAGDDPEAPPASRAKFWIVALAAAAVILVAGGIGAYVFLSGGDEPGAVSIDIGGATVYQEFPEILTQLGGGESNSDHVKLQIVVELPESHVGALQDKEPVILDAVQSYLRGKTRSELSGEAGAERLRAELLVMINQRIAPAEAKDILFKTFLID